MLSIWQKSMQGFAKCKNCIWYPTIFHLRYKINITTINATDIKLHRILLHILLYFVKNPMKTFIFICIIKDSRKFQPYNLYIYIPICFQFDRNLCKVLELASDTLSFNTKIIRKENFKIFNLSLQRSILNEI